DTAFTVRANRYAADRWTGREQSPQGVAAVRSLRFGREPFDRIIRARSTGPLIRVGPDAELKLHPAPRGFAADELEHLEIRIPFPVRQRIRAHVVARNGKQERIREVKVAIGDVVGEIVSETECEVEAIEPMGREHGEVTRPERAIVEPR